MCKLFDEWSPQIKSYCERNNFDFEKVQRLSKCWGKDDIIFQYYDKNNSNSGKGLLDETPLPIVLKVRKADDGLVFEQTENTRKYLHV